MIFWDMGGEDELQCLWEKYYQEAHGVVYVIDASDEARLRTSQESFEMMIRHHDLEGVPLLVLANKVDLDGAMSIKEIKAVFNESAHLLGSRDCKVSSASALTGQHIGDSLKWLSQKVQENTAMRPPKTSE